MTRKAERKRELRVEIDRLPLATRRAMLEGTETETIVVGGDGDPRGGVCPIYATPRPPSKKIGRPFAKAWDRYAGARLPRRASERELSTLRAMLATSIEREAEEPPALSLRAAIASHKASRARSRAAAPVAAPAPATATIDATIDARLAGESDRTPELSRREGWAWLRPFRSYDDYERALRQLREIAPEATTAPRPERLAEHV